MKDIASPMVLAISLGCVIFLPFFSICFTDGLPPLPLILWTMSQHFFIVDVLAFNFDTYSCQLFFLLARMTCLASALFMRYSCKFAFVGELLKIRRDIFSSKIASLHSSENHGFCGFLGLGFDFGIVWLAISQSLSIKVSRRRPPSRSSWWKASKHRSLKKIPSFVWLLLWLSVVWRMIMTF